MPQEEGEELAKDLTLWCRSLDTVGGGPCCCGHDPAEGTLGEKVFILVQFQRDTVHQGDMAAGAGDLLITRIHLKGAGEYRKWDSSPAAPLL